MYDILIKGGCYPDFDKKEFVSADIAVKDGKIAGILEPGTAAEAAEIINAEGRVVTPGLIDLHMHEEDLNDLDENVQITRLMARMGVTTGVNGNCGTQEQHIADEKACIEKAGGLPINYVQLAGYNSWRHTQGLGFYDDATEEQRKNIQEIIKKEMEDGCYGISFGLEYDPGISYEEMLAAVKSLGDSCKFISVHFREDSDNSLKSCMELAKLSRDTGIKVEISHLGSLAGYGSHMKPALEYLEKEMAENPLLAYDIYPYTAFCTGIGSAVFDVDWRKKWEADYDIIYPIYEPYAGKTVTEEIYNDMRTNHPEQSVICFAMTEDNIRMGIAHRDALYGSDGGVTNGLCHPRSSGTFPRILGKYVREEGLVPLIEVLERMSKKAAARVDLNDRGEIKNGYMADLVIFDPDTVADGSTFENPAAPPVGIDAVIVSGQTVVKNNELTGALPGRIL